MSWNLQPHLLRPAAACAGACSPNASESTLCTRSHPVYHFTVKKLMARFDEDGRGVLSGDEIVKMNDLLLRKRREVRADITLP